MLLTQPYAIAQSSQEIQEALNRWSDQGFFRLKRLGDRIRLESVVSCSAYTLKLQTQYEQRTVQRASEPFHGGAVDDVGVPPDPFQISVACPKDFEERTERIRVPHTESVEGCRECSGSGRVSCSFCLGRGRTTCPWCGGSGSVMRTVTRTETDAQGVTTTRTEMVNESCSCIGGQVTCSSCGGSGHKTCSSCNGSGRIRTFDLLTVDFRCPTLTDVLDATGVPNPLLGTVTGKTVADERAERIPDVVRLDADADQRIAALLAQSHSVQAGQTCIHFQHLHVEQVPIQEVTYRYREGEPKRLWVYGAEAQVFAPDAPKSWLRIFAVALFVAATVGGIVYAILYYNILPKP